jgi:hypothetical protein
VGKKRVQYVPDARKQARFSLVLILKNEEASLISSAFGTILAKYHDGERGEGVSSKVGQVN